MNEYFRILLQELTVIVWLSGCVVGEANNKLLSIFRFLAALSSSRSLVVCLLVGLSVCLSGGVCEKVTYRVSNGN